MSRHVLFASSIALLNLACSEPSSTESSSQTTGESTSTETSTETSTDTDTDTDTGETDTAEPDLPEPPSLDPMVVMTFNILCSFCDDTYPPWEERVDYISDTIERHNPDIVGLQELFTGEEVQQLLDLQLPIYDALYYSDETSDYADATIWWRNDRYELIDSGFYWLSPAPDTPYSVGFSPPQLPRLVAWVQLRQLSSGGELLFVDTHFDNNSPSQELSAPLLLERTEAQAGALPIVVVGDFNSRPDSAAYAILVGGVETGGFALTNSFDLARSWSIESNQDPVPGYDPAERIDHIFVAGGQWSVPWWVVDTWVYGPSEMHTSDHFAMAAELHFGAN